MTLDALVMLVGAIVAVAAFLGFPVSWYGPIYFILGVIVIGLGIVARRRGLGKSAAPAHKEFVESAPQIRLQRENPDTEK